MTRSGQRIDAGGPIVSEQRRRRFLVVRHLAGNDRLDSADSALCHRTVERLVSDPDILRAWFVLEGLHVEFMDRACQTQQLHLRKGLGSATNSREELVQLGQCNAASELGHLLNASAEGEFDIRADGRPHQ